MFKILRTAVLGLTLALTLSACGSGGPDLSKMLTIATTTIVNPADAVDIYRMKLAYNSALKIANKYRATCYPPRVTFKKLMENPVTKTLCRSRRSIVEKMIETDDKAFAAVVTAANFVQQNPTLNAASVIGAAWNAVTDFQTLAVPYSGLVN